MEKNSQGPLSKSTNIIWHQSSVDRAARTQQRGHGSAILWFTGLSGSGKSTLANSVNEVLHKNGYATYAHLADISSHKVLKKMVEENPQLPGISSEKLKKVWGEYIQPVNVKKIDIGTAHICS